ILFQQGYLVNTSAHAHGSAVDVGLVPAAVAEAPSAETAGPPLKPCNGSKSARFDDGTVDLGTGYDCFDETSYFANEGISDKAKENRMLLRSVMVENGFQPIAREWWHFELKNEPFPYRQFDFRISKDPRRGPS